MYDLQNTTIGNRDTMQNSTVYNLQTSTDCGYTTTYVNQTTGQTTSVPNCDGSNVFFPTYQLI